MRMLGIVVCLIVASAYCFVWPGWKDPERVRHRTLWSGIILRWFHSLTWTLLAAACYLRSTFSAVLAGGVYLIFILALAEERKSARRGTTREASDRRTA
jgi:hypothetical protein